MFDTAEVEILAVFDTEEVEILAVLDPTESEKQLVHVKVRRNGPVLSAPAHLTGGNWALTGVTPRGMK